MDQIDTNGAQTGASQPAAQRFRLVNGGADRRQLVIGDKGISLTGGPRTLTICYDDCDNMQAYPDGARTLRGGDGVEIVVEPQLWHITPQWIEHIDARVPADRVSRQPARASIPQPAEAMWVR